MVSYSIKGAYNRLHGFTSQKTRLYQNTWRHVPEDETIPEYAAPPSIRRNYVYNRICGVAFQKTKLYQNTWRHVSEDEDIPKYTAPHPRRRGYTRLHRVTSQNTVTFTVCAVETPPPPNLILLYTKPNILWSPKPEVTYVFRWRQNSDGVKICFSLFVFLCLPAITNVYVIYLLNHSHLYICLTL
jgi:hypothetical protein